ncbi:MAG: NFACT RNA binding domain-containing protein [Acidobacteria bacterium]|nr:NFACT RNA binding domain-containing protein [Acidobacteriota bacterium]
MDAITLDRILGELRPLLTGRHLSRPRLVGPTAVCFETSASRDRRLWLDAGRGSAGVYWVGRETVKRLADERTSGRSRQARLHLRKHLDGARVTTLARIAGERTVRIETREGELVLRLSGPAPALTLVVGGAPLATLGDGPEAWPLPPEAPEREPDRLAPEAFESAVAAAQAAGRSRRRAVLAACPALGPTLAAELDGSAASFAEVVEQLRRSRPTLVVPGPPSSWHDADLAGPDAVLLAPAPLERPGRTVLHLDSWSAAAELFLEARRRGLGFERRRRAALRAVRRRVLRLEQLGVNLARDLARLADETVLRREAEALLALATRLEPGASEVTVPDPHEPGRELILQVDPKLGGVQNAERRFQRARRAERARRQIDLRRREAVSALEEEREREGSLLEARDGHDLDTLEPVAPLGEKKTGAAAAGPPHYLTSRGLSILVGRNARENQHLTFRVARPEDLWFHARDAPGSHVILRDNEGRAGAADLREAGEVAAFFSEARRQPKVDVHATRRKHVRPAGGGPGRVFVGHSETLRVVPRDPEGRLRRR